MKEKFLTFMAAMSLSCDSLIFFITSFSARPQASMVPFIVMVRSGLYRVRSCRLEEEEEEKQKVVGEEEEEDR